MLTRPAITKIEAEAEIKGFETQVCRDLTSEAKARSFMDYIAYANSTYNL